MASAIGRQRRLHRQEADDLQEMVLDDVADRAGLVVEAPAPLHAELLRHGDLHALDVVAVPDRLEERVGEAEHQQGSAPTPCPGSGRCGRSPTRRTPRAACGSARAPTPDCGRTASRSPAARSWRSPSCPGARPPSRTRWAAPPGSASAAARRPARGAALSNVLWLRVFARDVAQARHQLAAPPPRRAARSASPGSRARARETAPASTASAPRRSPACRGARAGSWHRARGRSSCRRDRRWRRRRPARRISTRI